MPLNPLNHHYSLENPASVYDEEAMTALQLAARTTAKVNETVEAFNKLETETDAHLERQDTTIEQRMTTQDDRITKMNDETMPAKVNTEVQRKIDSGEFDAAIDQYAGNLESRVNNLLGKVVEGSTTMDAEVIDLRTDYAGKTHTNAGEAVRTLGTNAVKATAKNMYSDDAMKAPYDDFDTLPLGEMVLYSGAHPKNAPPIASGCALTLAYKANNNNFLALQLFWTGTSVYMRQHHNQIGWSVWKSIVSTNDSVVTSYKNVYQSSILPDLNDAEFNRIYLFSTQDCANMPTPKIGILTCLAPNGTNYAVQFYNTFYGEMYCRTKFGSAGWTKWVKLSNDVAHQAEAPFADLALFPRIGVVGDSYASGAIYFNNSYNDNYAISWPQILARKKGVTVTNYTRGGLATDTWLTSPKGLTLMQSSPADDLYILALGINDNYHYGEDYLGSLSDITAHNSRADYANTFYGNYGRIIEEIKEHAPHAKIVIMGLASDSEGAVMFTAAIQEIANHYGIAYAAQRDDAFFLDSFYRNNMISGHPTAVGYAGMACAIERLLNKCMVEQYDYFRDTFMY